MSTSSVKSSVCIFCFENEPNASPKGKTCEEKSLHVRRFFTMVQRYFEEKTGTTNWSGNSRTPTRTIPPYLPVPADLKLACCDDCFIIVDSYLDIYHKMKCLELELDKCVDKIKSVMSLADEDASKINGFIQWSLRETGTLEKSMEFRQMFLENCKIGSLALFPKLSLDCDSNVGEEDREPRRSKRNLKSACKDVSNHDNFFSLQSCPPEKPHQAQFSSISEHELPTKMIKLSPPNSPSASDGNFENDGFAEFDMNLGNEDSDWDGVLKCPTGNVGNSEEEEFIYSSPSSHSDGNVTDSDWCGDEIDTNNHYSKEKRKIKRKSGTCPPTNVQTKTAWQSRTKIYECHKCGVKPFPSFASKYARQIHNYYLHTNGNVMLNQTEAVDILHLTVKDLQLKDLDTTVKRCSELYPNCAKEFMLEEELNIHQMYHGDFKCDNCEVFMDDAMDMAYHQLEHLKSCQKDVIKLKLICGKCPCYSTVLEGEFINHILEIHMGKPKVEAICPICLQQFKYVDRVPFLHYLNYHDLTRLGDSTPEGILCSEKDCSAFFLTEDQLQLHKISIHVQPSPEPELVKSDTSLCYRKGLERRKMRYRNRDFEHACEYCHLKFRFGHQLNNHTWGKHAEEKMRGVDSGRIQLTKDGLTVDEFIQVNECVCEFCDKVLPSKEQLQSHRQHHGEFKCNFCDVVETLATELAVHEAKHKDDSNKTHSSNNSASVTCSRCTFTTTKHLDYIDHHLETHLGLSSDRKRCPICSRVVPSKFHGHPSKTLMKKWVVRHHMEFHDQSDLNPRTMPKCSICPAYFRTPVQLHDHSRDIHGKHTIRECCDCGKVFAKSDKLRSHRTSIHKVDESTFQYFCSHPGCGYKFERQIELDYHESSAHNEKDDVSLFCPECRKRFVGKGQLAGHMKSHSSTVNKVTKKKAVKSVKKNVSISNVCDQCGKTFRSQYYLQAHIKRHSSGPEEWRFECSICSKKCSSRSKLTDHVRTHTKEKPYVCELCGVAFGHSRDLCRHKIRTHDITE